MKKKKDNFKNKILSNSISTNFELGGRSGRREAFAPWDKESGKGTFLELIQPFTPICVLK